MKKQKRNKRVKCVLNPSNHKYKKNGDISLIVTTPTENRPNLSVFAKNIIFTVSNASFYGTGLKVIGNCNFVKGKKNEIVGHVCTVIGNNNKITGNGNTIDGDTNLIIGNQNKSKGLKNQMTGNGNVFLLNTN